MQKIEKLTWYSVTDPMRPTHGTLTLLLNRGAELRKKVKPGYWDEKSKSWRHWDGSDVEEEGLIMGVEEAWSVAYWAIPTGKMR